MIHEERVASGLTLVLHKDIFSICRLEPSSPIPAWATATSIWSITRTSDELSVVCVDVAVPRDVQCERDWRMIQVAGPLDFALTGILASIATPLADAGISIFALATFDTDYILVRQDKVELALTVLTAAGHHVVKQESG